MSHRKSLTSKGFKSHAHGDKNTLNYIASNLKSLGRIKKYRIVPYKNYYELYVKR